MVNAMQLEFEERDDGFLLRAPLAPNKNHMGTGFGGSLAAMATLAGWAQTWKLLPDPENTHIVIGRSEVTYLEPATSELIGRSDEPADSDVVRFLERLEQRGRAGLQLTTRIYCHEREVTRLSGKFVATCKQSRD